MTENDNFNPARSYALKQLSDFVPHAGGSYAAKRNFDFGPGNHSKVSSLSPWIRHRIITEREVVEAVLTRHSLAAAEKYIQEVLWRTYWKGWLEMRPSVWTNFLSSRDDKQISFKRNVGLLAAEAGTTGIDGFDDWARELVETGYLHNHTRMWFASIWIFTLKLPWALGADFFLRHLIDADPASNTLSWRWVAGLQTVGKTYLATADNITRYSNGRFSPKGLATYAEALHDEPAPMPQKLPDIIDASLNEPALLLVTAEDYNPESFVPASKHFAAALVCRSAGKNWLQGDVALAFVDGAAEDCKARITAHYGCTTESIDTLDAEIVIEAAKAANVKIVVTPYAPVGPVADALKQLGRALSASDIKFVYRRRSWDAQFWPHAKKGFFPFKEHIAKGLMQEGIASKQLALDLQ